MRIVFLGTPEFAVATLEKIVEEGFNVVGVVTAPDKPAGRGLKMKATAVAEAAERLGIPVLKPSRLKDPEFIAALQALQADIQVVVAFRMLPEIVWNMPPLGTWNLHASLLPQYRGAAPINHAIINGETVTGVSTFKLVHEIDRGAVAMQREVPVGENTTAGELHDILMQMGAGLMAETLHAIENGSAVLQEQHPPAGETLKEAPKLNPAFCSFSNALGCKQAHNLIRGLSPYPGVHARLRDENEVKELKLYRSALTSRGAENLPDGTLLIEATHIYICMHDGLLEILELQPAGKRRMQAAEFINGLRNRENLVLE
ncbi:MAG: methionyl-tRNA formyltransferase [Bacteroidia bacterium]